MARLVETIMNEDLVPLCERLRRVRVVSGIPQKRLAKELGISAMGLSYLERGKRRLNLEFLFRWAGKFGLNFDLMFKNLDRGDI